MVLSVPARVPKPYPQVASVPRGSRGKDMANLGSELWQFVRWMRMNNLENTPVRNITTETIDAYVVQKEAGHLEMTYAEHRRKVAE